MFDAGSRARFWGELGWGDHDASSSLHMDLSDAWLRAVTQQQSRGNANVTIKQISSPSNYRRCHDNWKQSICCLRWRRKKDFTGTIHCEIALIDPRSLGAKLLKPFLPRAMWLRIGRAIMYNNWVYERIKILLKQIYQFFSVRGRSHTFFSGCPLNRWQKYETNGEWRCADGWRSTCTFKAMSGGGKNSFWIFLYE